MKNQVNIKGMLKQTTFLAITIFGLALFSQSMVAKAQGQESDRYGDNRDTTSVSKANKEKDTKFLKATADVNMEDVRLGQLAQQRGSSSKVIELGREMQEYHQKSLNELTALAKTKKVTIPSASSTPTTNKSSDVYNTLKEKSGEDFDKSYAKLMVDRHEETITSFEKISTESNDPEIKAWASESLTALRTHLEHSKDVYKMYDTK